jgi:capsular polysaccharide biosynthesis protein
VPAKPLPNHGWLTLAMGMVASLAVGVGGAFTMESLSPTVRGRHDAEQRLALPVLAVIPEDV